MSDEPPPRKRVRKSRGRGLRVKTGCIPCRNRHLKCGEEKPSCSACVRARAECVYSSNNGDGAMATNPDHATSTMGRSGRSWSLNSTSSAQQAHAERSGSCASQSTALPEAVRPVHRQDDALPPQHVSPAVADHPAARESVAYPYTPAFSESLAAVGDLQSGAGESLPATSPDPTWPPQSYTAEAASLRWFGLLATDQDRLDLSPSWLHAHSRSPETPRSEVAVAVAPASFYTSQDQVILGPQEMLIFRHFVQHLSSWIDATDPDRLFSVLVPSMALRNSGLMSAILAFSSRHLSLHPVTAAQLGLDELGRDVGVEYYHATLQYLQKEMKKVPYLTSDELLATVLTISSYEMIDESDGGWERHLKGVFWIQRSQLIHGESEGLKKSIWWSWLRQDIWAAFKDRRKILSFYNLRRPCSGLNFWELVNRSVYLLGQCVNYASDAEIEAGRLQLELRILRAQTLEASLDEWHHHFARFDCRLPTPLEGSTMFTPLWINPPAASLAIQVHYLSRLLLLENKPAAGGMRELSVREPLRREAIGIIGGIACCTDSEASILVSMICLYGAGQQTRELAVQEEICKLLHSHQEKVKWPSYDLSAELRKDQSAGVR
ncbi:uncharacterized protein RCC_02143 [Ramularia collo-cygni]|uniref:Zn(2)-C6 fungal-type domain-containing protein n=1 Tax=Ramularia collo-cygni TaxID=112498 RepID=A0A2D3UND3_9PEZI|nr:uncharacterized protein RCC_02143 [Ramularia collo-cygni]CZT16301.1 uncharacterized protein RCC_02143 [Ramularia collo-cygni]